MIKCHEKLKAIRASLAEDGRKVTQREMAVYFGTTPGRYCIMENGRSTLSDSYTLLIECMYVLMQVGRLRGVLKRFKDDLDNK